MIDGELDPEIALHDLLVTSGLDESLSLVLVVEHQTKAAFVVVLYIGEREIAKGFLDIIDSGIKVALNDIQYDLIGCVLVNQ